MSVSLVQESNWCSSIADKLETSKLNQIDLACSRHKSNLNTSFLVHVIDGFTIEESNRPFKGSEEDENPSASPKSTPSENIIKIEENNTDNNTASSLYSEDKDELMSLLPTKCKYCGSELPEQRAMWGKRFCSMSCCKRYSVTCSKRIRKALHRRSGNKDDEYQSKAKQAKQKPFTIDPETPVSAELKAEDWSFVFPSRRPLGYDISIQDIENELYDGVDRISKYVLVPELDWTIPQVAEFIRSIPGCSQYATRFIKEEIDGQALLLLKVEHMIRSMQLKLGPALKIAANVRTIKMKHGVYTHSKYLSLP